MSPPTYKGKRINAKLVAENAGGSAWNHFPLARAQSLLLNNTRVPGTSTSFLSNAKIRRNPKLFVLLRSTRLI